MKFSQLAVISTLSVLVAAAPVASTNIAARAASPKEAYPILYLGIEDEDSDNKRREIELAARAADPQGVYSWSYLRVKDGEIEKRDVQKGCPSTDGDCKREVELETREADPQGVYSWSYLRVKDGETEKRDA